MFCQRSTILLFCNEDSDSEQLNYNQIMMYLLPILALLIVQGQFVRIQQDISEAANSKTNILWPLPQTITTTASNPDLVISPCEITYNVQASVTQTVREIIDLYLIQVFHCQKVPIKNVNLTVVVGNVTQTIATDVKQEKYSLIISQNGKWSLTADYFVGFLRGFETFSQLFEQNTNGGYVVKGIPISISDTPQFLWRGLMIDTSRHFFPVESIKKAIDGLMYNKMSVLHWHITDEQSFPLYITARPQMSGSGALSGVYSVSDVKSIVAYAANRGVRVIPELDTPAHSLSWGQSPSQKDMVVQCASGGYGQFDPTVDLTYQVMDDVLLQANATFLDNYIHFGGDEVDLNCWERKPSIKQFMIKNNIPSYYELEIYFRQKQKKLWRSFSNKKVIYWANEDIDLPLQADDVIQWWGVSANVNRLVGRKNEVILSNYDKTYLDIGFGNSYGGSYGTYQNWRFMYSFNPVVTNVNIIGAEVCMWSEICNKNTFDQKVWIRSSVMGERLWNTQINIGTDLQNIATRLIAQGKRMRNRGFKVSPVTVGLCEKDPTICF